jgi:hypothetical protein
MCTAIIRIRGSITDNVILLSESVNFKIIFNIVLYLISLNHKEEYINEIK